MNQIGESSVKVILSPHAISQRLRFRPHPEFRINLPFVIVVARWLPTQLPRPLAVAVAAASDPVTCSPQHSPPSPACYHARRPSVPPTRLIICRHRLRVTMPTGRLCHLPVSASAVVACAALCPLATSAACAARTPQHPPLSPTRPHGRFRAHQLPTHLRSYWPPRLLYRVVLEKRAEKNREEQEKKYKDEI